MFVDSIMDILDGKPWCLGALEESSTLFEFGTEYGMKLPDKLPGTVFVLRWRWMDVDIGARIGGALDLLMAMGLRCVAALNSSGDCASYAETSIPSMDRALVNSWSSSTSTDRCDLGLSCFKSFVSEDMGELMAVRC